MKPKHSKQNAQETHTKGRQTKCALFGVGARITVTTANVVDTETAETVPAHTHTHTHVHTHTCKHTHVHTHTRAYTLAHTHTGTHATKKKAKKKAKKKQTKNPHFLASEREIAVTTPPATFASLIAAPPYASSVAHKYSPPTPAQHRLSAALDSCFPPPDATSVRPKSNTRPQNQMQETFFAVQFVPERRFLVFDFGVYRSDTA
eukprot:2458112-Rhodomonas_salina.1